MTGKERKYVELNDLGKLGVNEMCKFKIEIKTPKLIKGYQCIAF